MMKTPFRPVCLLLLLALLLHGVEGAAQSKSAKKPASSVKKTTQASKGRQSKSVKTISNKSLTANRQKQGGRAVPVKEAKKSQKTKGNTKAVPAKKSEAKGSREKKKSDKNQRAAAPPQTRALKLKQEELEKLRHDIQEYEARLARSRKQERSTLERLDDFGRQTDLIKRLVSHLNVQVNDDERSVQAAQSNLKDAETSLEKLQSRYARSVVNAYKRGKLHDTELLLSSTSLNQMFIRAKYLRAFTARQRAEAIQIRERKREIEARKRELEDRLATRQQTLTEKHREESRLKGKVEEHKTLLDKVRQDKAEYQRELGRKQAAAAKIERLIADLIENDRMRRADERRKKGTSTASGRHAGSSKAETEISDLPSRAISQTAFGRLKGRLPWPVVQGVLVGTFGNQVNPRFGTVMFSNGIDIKAPTGAAVRSVADGIVRRLFFIPGYGNLVIINHNDDFHTVYTHLSNIAVRMEQKVKAGQTIARVSDGVSGSQIHFELWRSKQKQNPLSWLSGR
jgi:murein hydrolase activator